jgi:hypothetical protein
MQLIGVLMAYAESDSTAQSLLAAFQAVLDGDGCVRDDIVIRARVETCRKIGERAALPGILPT